MATIKCHGLSTWLQLQMVTFYWCINMSWLHKAKLKLSAVNSAAEIIQSVLNNSMNLQSAVGQLRAMVSQDTSVCDILAAEQQAAYGANHANARALDSLWHQVCSDLPQNSQPIPPEPKNMELPDTMYESEEM